MRGSFKEVAAHVLFFYLYNYTKQKLKWPDDHSSDVSKWATRQAWKPSQAHPRLRWLVETLTPGYTRRPWLFSFGGYRPTARRLTEERSRSETPLDRLEVCTVIPRPHARHSSCGPTNEGLRVVNADYVILLGNSAEVEDGAGFR